MSAGIPSVFGILHGIYKKIDEVETDINIKFKEPKRPKSKISLVQINQKKSFYEKIKIARAIQLPQPIQNKDVKIAIETWEHHKKIKMLINPNDSIDDLFKSKSKKISLILKNLMENGFNPKEENLIDYLSRINIDEFNRSNTIDTKINFTDKHGKNLVQIIDGKYNKIINKGWKVLPSQVIDIPIKEKGGINLPPEIGTLTEHEPKIKNEFPDYQKITSKFATFKKILNPYDEKFFSKIEKLPFGKKITGFMKKTNSPIKEIKFKPFNKLFYDKTSTIKGAVFMATAGLGTLAFVNTIKKIYKNHQTKNK